VEGYLWARRWYLSTHALPETRKVLDEAYAIHAALTCPRLGPFNSKSNDLVTANTGIISDANGGNIPEKQGRTS
jgi:hypothetical protein